MGTGASKIASSVAPAATKRALPRAGAATVAPYVPDAVDVDRNVRAPVERSGGKDVKLTEMMSKLTVRAEDVSAVEFGYASTTSRAKKRIDRAAETLMKPMVLLDALARHRASGFEASAVSDIARERPRVSERVLQETMENFRAHVFEEVEDERWPGRKARVGRW